VSVSGRSPVLLLVVALTAVLAGACVAPPGVREEPRSQDPASAAPAAAPVLPVPSPLAGAAAPAPAACPDLAARPVAFHEIVATGAERLADCARAQGVTTLVFDAFFPAVDCGACGMEGPMTIVPGWLTGSFVAPDAHTGVLANYPVEGGWDGMRVTAVPMPSGLDADAHVAWLAANARTVRIPPSLGHCTTADTGPDSCTFAAYAGRMLRVTAHLFDAAARTCAWQGPEDVPPPEPAAVRAYCESQLVVDSVADPAAPSEPLPPTTSTE
jgi:hypothetical protein